MYGKNKHLHMLFFLSMIYNIYEISCLKLLGETRILILDMNHIKILFEGNFNRGK